MVERRLLSQIWSHDKSDSEELYITAALLKRPVGYSTNLQLRNLMLQNQAAWLLIGWEEIDEEFGT